MNCPKCSQPNATGAQYCNMCYEPFNKSAADRYLHAQRRIIRDRNAEESGESSGILNRAMDAPAKILSETARVDWGEIGKHAANHSARTVRRYAKEIGMAAAIILIGVLVVVYSSPAKRLQMFGGRFRYDFPARVKLVYLVTSHLDFKSWSERMARLDTPLGEIHKDEIGQIDVRRLPGKKHAVLLRPKEWIINQEGQVSQNIPLNHPSLAGLSEATLNRFGRIVDRTPNYSTRLGHTAGFILPRWPSSLTRPGDQWTEPAEWVEAFGEWKILWKGQLHWQMQGLESYEGVTSLHLTYRADLTPHLWESPAWTHGAVRGINYSGTFQGDVYFDTRRHQVFTNEVNHDGSLTISISDIYRIPSELRVGRAPHERMGRQRTAQPGILVLHLNEKFAIHRM
jgi:hypothetical protein